MNTSAPFWCNQISRVLDLHTHKSAEAGVILKMPRCGLQPRVVNCLRIKEKEDTGEKELDMCRKKQVNRRAGLCQGRWL